ncbi:MAG: methyl-accepting chemotaxis protein [Tepidibacter sp.]|jgi:methyl-accepting chemotaxis protein|uniref:methyl-accepting chemotaxis protein n=1 Tax=Tepidibacter sp. TaxID=2529387 RepID=UPI0025EE0EE4|nr:methyl-accepting chemotaxis protein [Tepidibacter sp.]MCT4509643.1 methyl-accepting chemotaxis protein [Tepidibacter sp.]
MMKLFKDWKIRRKILFGFLVIITIFVVYGMNIYMVMNRINDKVIPLIRNIDNVHKITLEMRRNEKDFLIRKCEDLEFYKTGKNEYIDKFELNFKQLKDTINLIKKDKMILSNEEDIKNLNEILLLSQQYHDKFIQLVDKAKTRGFNDYGLIGNLRKASHDIEEFMKNSPNNRELKILLLQIRREEKDYFLRKDLQYASNLEKRVSEFKTVLMDLNYNQKAKLNINLLIEEYKTSFDNVVSIDGDIGFKKNEGLVKDYREKVHSLEPLINEVHKNIIDKIDENTKKEIRKIIISIITINSIAIIVSFYIASLLTKPIKNMLNRTRLIALGDLTQEIKVDSRDEIGDLAYSLRKMQKSLKNLIGNINNTSDNVTASSKQLSIVSEENAQMSQQIAQAMEDLAIGVNSQREYIENTNEIIVNFMDKINMVNENSHKMDILSNDVSIQANLGKDVINTATNQMDKINITTSTASIEIKELNQKFEKVDKILGVMSNISKQTNLLALNAAIESARAGENGRGFAVVAEEIRKLSEQSQNSSEEIHNLINDLQNGMSIVVTSIEDTTIEVDRGKKIINKTEDAFEKILESIKETTQKIKEVSCGIEEMRESGEQATESVEKIVTIMNGFESNIQEVSASAEEGTASIEEIAATSDELAKMAEDLNSLVHNFKL